MKKGILKSIVYGFICLAILGCDDDEVENVGLTNLNLVFQDNFEGAAGASINTDIWNFDIGNGVNGWGNQESQYYTDRPENISLDGQGNMVITARRESFEGFNFTSARINTRDNFEHQFGRFEARIQMPGGRGLWPAFWMLGSNIETEPDDDPETIIWPFVGEIDITEQRGQQPFRTHGSVHGPGYSAGQALTGLFDLDNGRFDQEFHVYAIEWTPDAINYFLDDQLYNTITPGDVPEGGDWVFDNIPSGLPDIDLNGDGIADITSDNTSGQPFFLLLNLAVEGSFVGDTTPSTSFPQQMIVDYVRVYSIEN